MHDQANADLFPTVLRRPFSLWWLLVLPSVLLTLVNSFSFWLIWGEMKSGTQETCAGVLLALSFLPALGGCLAVPFGARKPAGLPMGVHVVAALLCLTHLFVFCWLIGDVLPQDTPDWIIGPSFVLIQFACMMPGLFTGLWRIAGLRLMVTPLADFGLSLLMTFLPPALLYFVSVMIRWMGRTVFSWHGSEHLFRPLTIAFLVAGPMLFFLGLLRCLMIARRFFIRQGEKSRAFHMGYVGCVALVLPVAGLLLNKQIPFPADFQNPWPYLLTLLNGASLMMPETGKLWVDAGVRTLRRVLFPFHCYFFLVFLPFLPLSILAILGMGTGFLILAPTLLFLVHGQILKRDFEQEAAGSGRRGRVWVRTLLCLLVIPLCVVARSELDRCALHRTLDFRYAPDYRKEARLLVPPAFVRHVLLNVRHFKDGAELPYITNWYNWRVFDNMLLQDAKAEELWRLIVGGEPPAPVKEDLMRNAFASLFGGKTRSPERRGGGTQRPMPRNVVLTDVQAAASALNGETETCVRLVMTSRDAAAQAEYLATLKVPPGVWVSGFKLKIGEKWEDGRVVERKAAEWVYRQIRDVSRRDPAILRYESEDTLLLRVFPFAPRETREVEITFLCPEGYADAIMIGDRRVTLGDGTLKPVCAWANGVLVKNPMWTWPEQGALVAMPCEHLLLDCSAGMAWDENTLTRVVQRVREEWVGVQTAQVTFANYETTPDLTVRLDDVFATPSELRRGLLPSRGAFDADGVLRRLARQYREKGLGAGQPLYSPSIVFVGNNVRKALEGVKAETWQAFRSELPEVSVIRVMGLDGAATDFFVPGSERTAGSLAVLAAGGECRRMAGTHSAMIAFTRPDEIPCYLESHTGKLQPVPGLTVMPPESR
ncbi:MAG: MSEP-CTERM sorting domain-containing protein [bacterium]